LFTREYTSPEASDAENNDRVVVDEPFHRAPLVSFFFNLMLKSHGHARLVASMVHLPRKPSTGAHAP
jgi:hypothetical protein